MAHHLILLAHGSPREAWRQSIEALAERVRAATPVAVTVAWLEAASPDLFDAGSAAVRAGARRVGVLPLFWSGGGHVARDVPALLAQLRTAWPAAHFELLPVLGEHPRVVAAIAAIAAEAVEITDVSSEALATSPDPADSGSRGEPPPGGTTR